jgi:hypothetical protein
VLDLLPLQNFRPNGLLVWFLYNLKKNFKISKMSPGSFFSPNISANPYYNPRAIQKHKKLKFSHGEWIKKFTRLVFKKSQRKINSLTQKRK